MILSMRMRRAALVLVTSCLLAVVPFAAPAQAASAVVDVLPVAGLQASGAAIVASASILCTQPNPQPITVLAMVSQVGADGAIIHSTAVEDTVCDGIAHVIRFAVLARLPQTGVQGEVDGALPFRLGSAFVTMTTTLCTPTACRDISGSRSVRVREVNYTAQPRQMGWSLSLSASGSLQAQGAGVIFRLSYRCPLDSPSPQRLFVTVVQRGANGRLIGIDNLPRDVDCPRIGKTVPVAVHANHFPWHSGPAFVLIGGQPCGPTPCLFVWSFRTMQFS